MNRYQHACYLNAKSLLKASKLLFEKKIYGHSAALSTLAVEECGKGFIFMVHNPEKEDPDFVKKKIKSHKGKLELAATDAYLMGIKHEGFLSKIEPIKSIEDFEKKIHKLMNADKKFLEFGIETYLINDLQPLKEKGLYVDIEGRKIITPKEIKRKEAVFMIKLAEKVVRYFPKTHGPKVT